MRVCLVTSVPFPPEEGIGYYVWNLAEQLVRKGHGVQIMTRGAPGRETCEHVGDITIWRPAFAPVYPLHVHVHSLFANRLASRLEREVDVFHLHTPLPAVLRTSRPVVVTFHTAMRADTRTVAVTNLRTLLMKLQGPVTYRIEERLLRSAAHVTAVASTVAAELGEYGVDAETVSVLGNGVNPGTFAPDGDRRADPPYILSAGRLEQRKGFQDLVKCARIVCQRHPTVQFRIAGKGPMEGELRAAIQAAGLKGRVLLLGHAADRSRMIELYRQAAVFVHPSYREGLPTVILEAMACGTPVVSAAVCGALDVVVSGENGLLTPPRDIGALSEAILRLLGDPHLCTRLGQAARHTIESRFSWDAVSDNFIRLYVSLLGASETASRRGSIGSPKSSAGPA